MPSRFIGRAGEIIPEDVIKLLSGDKPFPIWTPQEEAIMNKYYGYVKNTTLLKALPNHTLTSMEGKAKRMGITNRRRLKV